MTTQHSSPQVIDQYLRGELSEDELKRFEIRMLEDPSFYEEVVVQESMQRALSKSSVYEPPSVLVEEPVHQDNLRSFFQRLINPNWGVAVSLCLASFFLGTLTGEEEKSKGIDAVIADITAPVYRGDSDNELGIIAIIHPGVILFSIDPGQRAQPITIEIVDPAGQVLLSKSELSAQLGQLISITVPSELVKPGRYQLRATDQSASVVDYYFEISSS